MKYVLALLVAACLASTAKAGWFAEITFAPQPYISGPVMVYRGDYVPYYYAYPPQRYQPRGYYPQPQRPQQYNRNNHPGRYDRYNQNNQGHRRPGCN